ncbi:hypothetical protein ABVK25_006559 [Lepraria finkii]|uniref:Phosphoglycerate mutase family protein n=1 Tax=Lepraria finkii TaxID=1340010 RepID=A0ABR4B5U2_9LECA
MVRPSPFHAPLPAPPSLLQSLFPAYSLTYAPSIIPSTNGESVAQLHDRIAYALQHTILYADAEDAATVKPESADPLGPRTAILICTHAASMIAIGRVLTGRIPDDITVDDFKTFTCGISKFERRSLKQPKDETVGGGLGIPKVKWKSGRGVLGAWDCVVNGDCSHLEGGEERGWHFQGDEAFDDGDMTHRRNKPRGDDDDRARHASKL